MADAKRDRIRRVLAAGQAGLHRVKSVDRADIEAAFGPIGEVLAWVCAGDELLRTLGDYLDNPEVDISGRTLLGFRFARNHSIHGLDVASVAERTQGSEIPMTIPFVIGASRLTWIDADLLPRRPKRGHQQEMTYRAELMGHDVVDSLQAALDFLTREAARLAGEP